MTADGNSIHEPSVVVVVNVVDVTGESGEDGAEMRVLAFFDLVKKARVVTAYITRPPPVGLGTSLGWLGRRAHELFPHATIN